MNLMNTRLHWNRIEKYRVTSSSSVSMATSPVGGMVVQKSQQERVFTERVCEDLKSIWIYSI